MRDSVEDFAAKQPESFLFLMDNLVAAEGGVHGAHFGNHVARLGEVE